MNIKSTNENLCCHEGPKTEHSAIATREIDDTGSAVSPVKNTNSRRWQKQINRAIAKGKTMRNLAKRKDCKYISDFVAEGSWGPTVSFDQEQFTQVMDMFNIIKGKVEGQPSLREATTMIGVDVVKGVVSETLKSTVDSIVAFLKAIFGKHYKTAWVVFATGSLIYTLYQVDSYLTTVITVSILGVLTTKILDVDLFSDFLKTWQPEADLGFGPVLSAIHFVALQLFPKGENTITKYLSKFKGFANLQRDLFAICDVVFTCLKGIINSLCERFGFDFRVATVMGPEIDSWVIDARNMSREVNKGMVPLTRNNYDKILNLEDKGYGLITKFRSTTIGKELGVVVRPVLNLISSMRADFEARGVFSVKTRQPPAVAFFMGESQIGKSRFLRPLTAYVLSLLDPGNSEHIATNLDEYVYSRQPEHVYWDGYYGQEVCFFDEFGVVLPDHVTSDNCHMDMIRCGNVFNNVLHMAGIEQKGNTYFRSKLIFATGNVHDIAKDASTSVSFPEASVNRFHFVLEVSVSAKYATPESMNNEPRYRVLDKSKITEEFNWEVHEFRRKKRVKVEGTTNQFTWVDVPGVLSAKEVANLIAEKYRENARMVDVLRADDLFAAAMATEGLALSTSGFLSPNSLVLLLKDAPGKLTEEDNKAILAVDEMMKVDDRMGHNTILLYDHLLMLQKMNNIVGDHCAKLVAAAIINSTHRNFMECIEEEAFCDVLDECFVQKELSVPQGFTFAVASCVQKLKKYASTSLSFLKHWFRNEAIFDVTVVLFGMASVKIFFSALKMIFTMFKSMWGNESKEKGKLEFEAQASDPGLEAVVSKVWKSCYSINNEDKKLGYGHFCHSTLLRFPSHFLDIVRLSGNEEHVLIINCVTFEETKIPVSTFLSAQRMGGDLAQLEVSNIRRHSDIRPLLTTQSNFTTRTQGEVLLVTQTELGTVMRETRFRTRFNEKYGLLDKAYMVPVGITYETNTSAGDCGAPVFLSDPSCRNQRFVGFHVAGSRIKGSHALGLATIFPDEFRAEGACDDLITMKIVGKVSRGPGIATQTKIRKSKLYEAWGPALKAPATLTSFIKDDGEIVHPLSNAIKKYDAVPPVHDLELVSACVSGAINQLYSGGEVPPLTRVSFTEAIFGKDGTEFFDGLNMQTSPGFPWNVFPSPYKGKERFFEQDANSRWKWKDSPDAIKLRSNLEMMDKKLHEGEHIDFNFTGSLKDELRSREKVVKGDTRYFAASPIEYTILFNRYFKSFVPFMYKNRIRTEMMIGVNPYSEEWDVFARLLLQIGECIIAGDFKAFDASQAHEILMEIGIQIIEQFDDREFDHIRMGLWDALVNSRHVVGNTIIQWNHSLPSGHPWTTIINCLYNSTLFRMAWAKAAGKKYLGIFTKHVLLRVFGDDNIMAVSTFGQRFFTQSKLTAIFKTMGLTYTSEKKDGDVSDFRTIDQVEFLKRGFRYEPALGRYLAPLRLETILEMPYWTKKDNSDSIACDNVNNALRELSLHDVKTFDEWAPKILKSALKEYQYRPLVTRRDDLMHLVSEYVPNYIR